MLTRVSSLKVVAPHGLDVRFSDGSGGVHGCTALVQAGRGLASELADTAYFARAFLDFGAPTWPNSFDMDAEWLCREMIAAGELLAHIAAE